MTTMLLTAAITTTLVLTATLCAAAAARRRSAATRHWVLTVGLAMTLVVPAVSRLWPPALTASLPAPTVEAPAPPPPPLGTALPVRVRTTVAAAATASVSRAADVPPRSSWASAGRLAVGAWALGAALALSRLGWGLRQLRRFRATATLVDEGPWPAECAVTARRLGISRPVRLLQSAHPHLLVTWGWRTPTILLPESAASWSPERRHIVLTHELAHIARGDWQGLLAAETVRALHFYHPLAWAATRRARLESERAADDYVLAGGVDRVDYASHLLALAQQAQGHRPWTPAPAVARPSSLEGRIRAMLDPTIDRTPLTRRTRRRIAALALVGMLPLAAITIAQAQFHTLHGTLVDSTGRVLPNVTVALTNDATAARYEVRSDASGRYEFVGLPASTYSLEAKTLGFKSRTASISVTGDRDFPLRLAVATLQETISVVSAARSTTPEDPVVAEQARARDDERRTRAAERQARAVATCAAGPPTAAGGNILAPWKIRHVNPVYPAQAHTSGLGGTVTMHAVIDTTGSVRDVRDVKGPSADLETAAVEAVREWRFTPTLLNCEAIEVEMDVTVDFAVQK